MDNQIIKKEQIFLDIDLKEQKEVFDFIAKKAFELKIVTKQDALIKGFKDREIEGSTGFEDGFAIPHARIKEIKKPAVFVLRFKNGINWKSMDGKPTKVAIALLVPETSSSGDQHLTILSDVALKLMDTKFKIKLTKAKTINEVIEAFELKNEKNATILKLENETESKKLNILAVTACVTGIAHTYMAEEKLLKTGKELGYNIRVETHGSKGTGTPFNEQEIANANLVIFATDLTIDNSRFDGKKFYQTTVAKAIKEPQEVIKRAIADGVVLKKNVRDFTNKNGKQLAIKKTGVLQHILAGISYMIPIIVLGGICLAFSLGLAKAIWGPEAGTKGIQIGIDKNGNPIFSQPWGPLAILEIIGASAFTLMIPVLAGFIANSIGGRAAIAPAMVGAFIGNDASKFMPLPGMETIQTPTG